MSSRGGELFNKARNGTHSILRWQIGNLALSSLHQGIPAIAAWSMVGQGSDSVLLGSFIGMLTAGEMLGTFTIARALRIMNERTALFVCSLTFILCAVLSLAWSSATGLAYGRIYLYIAAIFFGCSNGWRSSIFEIFIARHCSDTMAALELRRLIRYSMISAVIGPSLAGIFLTWRNTHFAMALAFCAAAAPVLLLVPWNHSEIDKNAISDLETARSSGGTLLRGGALLARLRPMWTLLAISFSAQACLSVFFSFVLPAFTSRAGLPPWAMTSFENVFSIFGFVMGGLIIRRACKGDKRKPIVLLGASIAVCVMAFSQLFGARLTTFELTFAAGALAAVMGSAAVALDSIVNPLIYLTVPKTHQAEFVQFTAIVHRFVLLSAAWFAGYLTGHVGFAVVCFAAGALLAIVMLAGGLGRIIAPLLKLEDHEIPGAYGRLFPFLFGQDVEK